MQRSNRFSSVVHIFFAAAIIIGGWFVAASASALTVSPPLAEIDLEPGVETTLQIKLFNETDDTLAIYTEVVSWTAQDDTGTAAFDLESEPIGLSSWITLPEGPLVIDSGENAAIPVTITPPVDASPGGHYAALFFSENPPENVSGGQVAIGSKVTSLLLASVAGDIDVAGRIVSLSTPKKVLNRLPVEFLLRFQNTGNIHLRPTGTIEIKNMFGSVSDTVDVNIIKGATLPDQIRSYQAIWEKHIVEKTGKGLSGFFTEFGNEWKNFALGKYTATANLTSQTEEGYLTHTAQTSFWVFPWRVIVVLFVGLVIAVFLLFVLLTRYNKWVISKAQQHATHIEKPETPKRKKK